MGRKQDQVTTLTSAGPDTRRTMGMHTFFSSGSVKTVASASFFVEMLNIDARERSKRAFPWMTKRI